jgi:hypothetical protein
MFNKIIKKIAIVLSFVLVMGGGILISCALEASVDSPSNKRAALDQGVPDKLIVYEPQIVFEGSTSVLTYKVAVDWPSSDDVQYTAQSAAATKANATAQSVEALIWQYGTAEGGSLLSGLDTSSGVVAGSTYTLKNAAQRFVIIPLDTELIKRELQKKGFWESAGAFPSLVWVEDNKDGIAIESPTYNWGDGDVYAASNGIRVWGVPKTSGAPAPTEGEGGTEETAADAGNICTIANFAEGDPAKNQPISIATVLVAGTTSTINFYIGGIPSASMANGEAVKKWMESGSATPGVRVVYEMEK